MKINPQVLKDHGNGTLPSEDQTSTAYQPKVSVVITTHNRKEKVLRTIRSVLSSTNLENILEIIVIDDASTDGTYASIRNTFSTKGVRVLKCAQEQLVSECRNIGLNEAKGEYVFFLDDDVVVSPETMSQLLKFLLENKDVVCVLPIILYFDKHGTIWCAGIKHDFWTARGRLLGKNELDIGQFRYPISSDSVITAFMIRKSIAVEVGFDSKTFPIGWEDMDFAIRLKKAGFDVFVLPWVKVWHDFPTGRFVKDKLRLYFEVTTPPSPHPNAKSIFKNKIKYALSPLECLKDADCCIIVTEWDEFKKLTPEDLTQSMKRSILIDGRRIYNPEEYSQKVKFVAIGLGK